MCTTASLCLHGTCTTDSSTGLPRCECDALYTGAQCSVRSGNQLFEIPLACVLVFALMLVGQRVADKALATLRFPESERDMFAFPRRFKCTQRSLGFVSKYVGTWSADDDTAKVRGIAFRKGRQHILANLFIVVAIALELVPWLQIAALAFLPAVPWSTTSRSTAQVRRSLRCCVCVHRIEPWPCEHRSVT